MTPAKMKQRATTDAADTMKRLRKESVKATMDGLAHAAKLAAAEKSVIHAAKAWAAARTPDETLAARDRLERALARLEKLESKKK